MHQKLIAVAFIGLVASASTIFAQADQDRIYIRGAAPKPGFVVKISPANVTLNSNGATEDIAANEIVRIIFGDADLDTKKLSDAATEGRYEEVIQMAEKGTINIAEIKNPGVKQDIEFYIANSMGQLALRGEFDKATAAGKLIAFIRENAQSYHYFDAVSAVADLAVSAGSYPNAAKYYKVVIDTAPWEDYKMRARVGAAKAAIAQNDYKTAEALYTAALQNTPKTDEELKQNLYAKVGLAVCKANSNDPDAGIKMVQDIIAKNDPKDMELFGLAYNALGSCYVANDQTEDALLAFLHTDILFYVNPDVHAEALYNIANLWDKLQKPDRAQKARSLLRARYKGTRWAAMN